jgi:anti-anti-sigma factor
MKNSGLFEIISPVMEEGDIFDSNMLKEYVTSLIAKGYRNFALDFSTLDYIYSDTINVILALNRQVLDVSGRLSILAPGPEVNQVLKRAGVHNILRIFNSEIDLIRSSEDIIMQTSSFKLSDIQKYTEQQGKPKSEFDQMKDELSGAFSIGEGRETEAGQEVEEEQAYQPQQPTAYPPPKPPEPVQQQPGYQPPPPPPPQEEPSYSAPQAFTPPPPPPPPKEQAPTPPPSKPYVEPEPDAFEFEDVPPRKQRRESPVKPKQPRDYEAFSQKDDLEDLFLEKSKKSPVVPILLSVLLVLLILGGGVAGLLFYLGYIPGFQMPQKSPEMTMRTQRPTLPEVPAIPDSVQEADEDETTGADEAVEDEELTKTVVKQKPKASTPTTSTPTRRRTPQRTSRTTTRRTTRSSTPAKRTVPKNNVMTITSSPSGALVTVDGKVMGTTPYTWNNPFFGMMNIKVSKTGYKDAVKNVEYTGGSKKEYVQLQAESPAPSYSGAESSPSRSTPSSSPSTSTTRTAPTPTPSASASTPRRSTSTPSSSVSSSPPRSSTPSSSPPPSSSTASGDPGTIFISSIPPVADVYMDGKLIGKTNISKLKVRSGTHTMRFVKGDKETTRQMTFKTGDNPAAHVQF